MSLLDADGLPPEFLRPVEFEEVELVENPIALKPNDEAAAVVYVNNDDDNFVSEGVYQWADGTVTIEEVVDNVEEIALQPFIDGEDTAYDDPQFEYEEEDVQVDVEGEFLDPNIPANNSHSTHFIDYDGVEYIEDELFPVANEAMGNGDVITGEEAIDGCEMLDDSETLVEYDAVTDAEPLNTGRRKPPTIVQCEICGVLLKHPSKIEAHMRTHTGEKPFECKFCGTKFTQRTPMLNHIRRHLGQMPYACSYGCGKKFVNNAQKNAHELRHLGTKRAGPPRPYLKPPKRSISNKVSSKIDTRTRQSEEERHAMVDFAPPVGQIDQPISATASKRLDEIIESVVSGVPIKKRKVRPSRAPLLVQCQICGLMLKHASKIRAHIRTHTGDKPYVCMYCDEQFGTSGTLKMHIKRKHTSGERPYACTWECGKRFVSLSTRNEHERVVHAGTKRYECTVPGCFRMFTRRQYLMLHRQKEHGLLFKPIFDPQEIANAEKEADRELRVEQQENLSCHYGQSDQILVDPSTNMLVHVSEDGMVLEPEIEQHTFMQGEFVEENDEDALVEIMADEHHDANSAASYFDAPDEVVQFAPSDIGLDPGSSGVDGVHLIEGEDFEDCAGEMQPQRREEMVECYKDEPNVNSISRTVAKDCVFNFVKKKPPRPSILGRRH